MTGKFDPEQSSRHVPAASDICGTFVPTAFQRRLWFLEQLDTHGSNAYVIPFSFSAVGELDIDAFRTAVFSVVCRHESLRMLFRVRDGEPEGVFVQPYDPVEVEDFSSLDEHQREARIASWAGRLTTSPFDFASGSMFRIGVARVDNHNYRICGAIHHIVTDGRSQQILFNEISNAYAQVISGAAVESRPAGGYLDYARRLEERLDPESVGRHLDYWRDALEGVPARLELPEDSVGVVKNDAEALTSSLTIGGDMRERVRRCALAVGGTPFMGFLSVFAAFLHRYADLDDLTVGFPIANRFAAGGDDVVGFLANTVLVRSTIEDRTTFEGLLENLRGRCLEAYEHGALPFDRMVNGLGLAGIDPRQPLCRVAFNYRKQGRGLLTLPGLSVSRLPVRGRTPKFDLQFDVDEAEGGLEVAITASPRVFSAERVGRMAGHIEAFAGRLLSSPGTCLKQLSTVPDEESATLLSIGSGPACGYRPSDTVDSVFRSIASRFADRIALVCGETRLTYDEVERLSDHVAARLEGHGHRGGEVVAMYMSRSVEAVVTMIGIVKARGVYLPIDTADPPMRANSIIEAAGARRIVFRPVERIPRNAIPAGVDEIAISLSEPEQASADCRATSAGSSSDAAYIMFTSGSTGPPKGIKIPHRGILRLCDSPAFLRASEHDVYLQYAPLAFDASTFEIWTPLLSGGRLVVAPPGTRGFQTLAAFVEGEKVTTLWLTSALFKLALDECPSLFSSVSRVLTGGEVMFSRDLARFVESFPRCELIHCYGPTENTTFTTTFPVPPGFRARDPLPIGRPVDGTRVVVMDRGLVPAPLGNRGEVCIAGDGLSLGYLDPSPEDAARFVSRDDFDRLYRTGDAGRWSEDGLLMFEGRLDRQVKIRGHRVEPEGVERALAADPVVSSAVVEVEEHDGTRRLVAYVKLATDAEPDWKSQLRRRLSHELPDYSIPSRLFAVESMPTGATGKVDRQGLKAASASSDTEAMASLWADVLELDEIPRADEDFFDLGGHSLLAIKLIDRVQKAFGCDLEPDVLFTAPTPETLLDRVRQATRGLPGPPTGSTRDDRDMPIADALRRQQRFMRGWRGARRTPDSVVLALNPDAKGPALLWCGQDSGEVRELVKRLGGDCRVFLTRSSRFICEPGEATARELAAVCAREFTAIVPDQHVFVGGYCLGGAMAVDIAHHLVAMGRNVRGLFLIEAIRHLMRRGQTCHVPAVHVFARDGSSNPYRYFRHPEIAFHQCLPNLERQVFVDGGHGRLLAPDRAAEFEGLVREWLFEKSAASTLTEDGEALVIRVTTATPLFLEAFTANSLDVVVCNDSGRDWLAGESGRVFVYSKWRDVNGDVIRWGDGPVGLPSIPAGGSAAVEITVEPPVSGARQLELDIVEEGVASLSALRGGPLVLLPVVVSGADRPRDREDCRDLASGWKARADLESERGDYVNAADSLLRCIRLSKSPETAQLTRWLELLYRAERYQQLIEVYDALPVLMKDEVCRLAAGDAFLRLGKPGRAAAVLDRPAGPAMEPRRLGLLADALMRIARFDESLAAARRMAELTERDEKPWMLAGAVHEKLDALEEALACYEKARKIHVTPPVLLKVAGTCLALGRRDRALEAIESATTLDAEYAEPYMLLFDCLQGEGRLAAAEAVYRTLVESCRNPITINAVLDYLEAREIDVAALRRAI